MVFKNRSHAGKLLAEKLLEKKISDDILILALPRGGVPVAYEVAKILHASFDLLLVRKLGAPGQEELAIGAITLNNIELLNEQIIKSLNISPNELQQIKHQEEQELHRRNALYRQNTPLPDIRNKTIIIIDDGIATGATIRAAIKLIRLQNPKKIIVAVPVSSPDIMGELKKEADDIVCLQIPSFFAGVGQWYKDFCQTSDEEVLKILSLFQIA